MAIFNALHSHTTGRCGRTFAIMPFFYAIGLRPVFSHGIGIGHSNQGHRHCRVIKKSRLLEKPSSAQTISVIFCHFLTKMGDVFLPFSLVNEQRGRTVALFGFLSQLANVKIHIQKSVLVTSATDHPPYTICSVYFCFLVASRNLKHLVQI